MTEVLWPLRLLGFLAWFVWQVLYSNVRVTRDIIVQRDLSWPVVISLPTRCRTEFELAWFSVLISLTPGTLVLATRSTDDDAPWTLFVHDLYADEDVARVELYRLEAKMLAALRPSGFDPEQQPAPAGGVS